jgi:hypothetical protein
VLYRKKTNPGSRGGSSIDRKHCLREGMIEVEAWLKWEKPRSSIEGHQNKSRALTFDQLLTFPNKERDRDHHKNSLIYMSASYIVSDCK